MAARRQRAGRAGVAGLSVPAPSSRTTPPGMGWPERAPRPLTSMPSDSSFAQDSCGSRPTRGPTRSGSRRPPRRPRRTRRPRCADGTAPRGRPGPGARRRPAGSRSGSRWRRWRRAGQVAALPLIEAPHLGGRPALLDLHKLGPAVIAAVDHVQRPERRASAALVQTNRAARRSGPRWPAASACRRPGTGAERRDRDRPPALVRIAGPGLEFHQVARVFGRREAPLDRVPSRRPGAPGIQTAADPLIDGRRHQPCQDRYSSKIASTTSRRSRLSRKLR